MKKLLYISISLIAFLPVFAHAADMPTCPTGQSPTASIDASNNVVYTCQTTISNTTGANVPINKPSNGSTAVPAGTCTNCNLGYTPLEPVPGLTTDLTNGGNLPDIVNAIFKIFITVGALLAVLSLAVGGIQYMVSSSAELKNAGIDRAKAALWGIVLIAASWLILNTINPNLLKFNLNPCPNGATGCTVSAIPSGTATPTGAAACGSDFPNGCASGTYCGTQLSVDSVSVTTCLSNSEQSTQQQCSSSGGQWTYGYTGNYCYLSNYTTSAACTAAGGSWSFGLAHYYCSK